MGADPISRSRRDTIIRLAAAAALFAAAACGGTDSSGQDAQPSASTSGASTSASRPADGEQAPDVPRLVDIGEGKRVFVRCAGSGSPTVVLESGDESDMFQWSAVVRPVAERSRVCAYDRLGNGSSDPAMGCRRTPELLADLQAMLGAVDAEPPYVLVGTSGGGFLMTSFAYAHPRWVAGIVLAETPHAIIPSREPAELLAELDCRAATNREHRDYVSVERHAWTHRHRLGRLPMTVITNDYRGNGENEEQQNNVRGQRGWLVLSPLARQVIVTSGHDVPENEPDLTVREILRVLDAARA